MNTNSKRLKIYLGVMLIATAVATSLRTIACMNHLNYVSGFFESKPLITAADIIIWLTVLGMLSYPLTVPRIKLRADFTASATYAPTGMIAVATAFLGVSVFSYANAVENSLLLIKLIAFLTAVLAFLSIGHHFLSSFITASKTDLRAYFAIATAAFVALYSMLIHLDNSTAISEPAKALRQVSFILLAIFSLYEARISLGREMWRIYSAFGLATASLTAYTSIPALITYFVKSNEFRKVLISSVGPESLASVEEYVFLLAAFIFVLVRLCLCILAKEDKENELIKALDEHASEREAQVNESFERHQETFASKQLSIFDLYGGDEEISESVEEEPVKEEPAEEAEKEIVISDDAIYESIFGKMPERPEPETEPEEEADERAPEEIAESIFHTVDSVMNESSDK